MRGRRPKPTALKILQGNPGKRRLNMEEPKPEGEVVKPTWVKERAARIWKVEAPIVQRMGLLTVADVTAFGRRCVLQAQFEKSPETFTASKMSQLSALESKFGLTPSDRARIFSGSMAPTSTSQAKPNPFKKLG